MPELTRNQSIALLTAGNEGAYVPCSRYGRSTEECAPVAYLLANVLARETGEPLTAESLDYAMGLVVNDHDDVAYTLREYATRGERRTVGLTLEELRR